MALFPLTDDYVGCELLWYLTLSGGIVDRVVDSHPEGPSSNLLWEWTDF